MIHEQNISVFTIIVTFNGEQWIRNCLLSIRESSISSHIIVVDNSSTDETINIIILEFPEVTLIQNEINLGFGKANNIGIQFALKKSATFLLLLNQVSKYTNFL